MAHQFYLQFSAPEWYAEHVEELRSVIERVPSFAREVNGRELWLKAKDSPGKCDFDLRIFLNPENVLVEVTAFGTAYFADLRSLIASLSHTVDVQLVDEDGEPVRWQ